MSQVTTLVVEDSEEYRHFLLLTLKEKTQCQIVGQASDGLEAIQKAEEFQPDLILLDLGLPKLNGMNAARRIRKTVPNSKILFVSQDQSIETAQAALRIGAAGYLLKSDGLELPVAVETVMQGQQFLSTSLEHSVAIPAAYPS
jgi:DNA-binding NarL/FixJ family response regulator